MAEVFLNPAFTALSGRIGGIVFYGYNDKTYLRSYVVPRNPDTPAQRANRDLFRDAMKAWQGLSLFDRESFNRRARRLGMTGHNLFISIYMASRRRRSDSGQAHGHSCDVLPAATVSSPPVHVHQPGNTPAARQSSLPLHIQGRSVSGSMSGRITGIAGPGAVLCPDWG